MSFEPVNSTYSHAKHGCHDDIGDEGFEGHTHRDGLLGGMIVAVGVSQTVGWFEDKWREASSLSLSLE